MTPSRTAISRSARGVQQAFGQALARFQPSQYDTSLLVEKSCPKDRPQGHQDGMDQAGRVIGRRRERDCGQIAVRRSLTKGKHETENNPTKGLWQTGGKSLAFSGEGWMSSKGRIRT